MVTFLIRPGIHINTEPGGNGELDKAKNVPVTVSQLLVMHPPQSACHKANILFSGLLSGST